MILFTTSIDQIVKRKTIGFLFLLLLPIFNLALDKTNWFWICYLVIFAVMYLISFLLKPLRYIVSAKEIIVERLIGNIIIPISKLERVDFIQHDLIADALKGGVFGYVGNFKTDLGKITYYTTRKDKTVMLTQNDGKKKMLTPDEVDAFIAAVEKSIQQQSSNNRMLS